MSTTLTVPVRVAPRRVIYIGLSGLMGLMAIVGFWPKYFGPLVLGTLVQPLLIHVHATVFTGWLVLFFLQAYFAATKRIQFRVSTLRNQLLTVSQLPVTGALGKEHWTRASEVSDAPVGLL